MLDRITVLIVDESKWLTLSMALAMLAVTVLLARTRRSGFAVRRRIAASMILFFGAMIGTMAFGHLLAVTTKLALGTLRGSLTVFYAIGIALIVPALWLVGHTRRALAADDEPRRTTVVLNAWLALTLLALGLHNLPLAAPGLVNVGYALHSRRIVGWLLVGVAVLLVAALFTGSLIFWASGQSFEQFRGLQ